MSGPGGDPPRHSSPQPNAYWDNLSERRLDDLSGRLKDLASQLAEMAKDMRISTRTSDQQASTLQRLEERLRGAEKELDELPKKVERLASAEWAARIDARVGSIEHEANSPFVRKLEFDPVKRAVFTLIGAICLAVLGAVAKLVMK